MKPTCLLLAATLAAAADSPDFLRLDDARLAGRFAGIDADGTLRWERHDAITPLAFPAGRARQLALDTTRPRNPAAATPFVRLSNGDTLPGRLLSLDGDGLRLETAIAGTLVIPRRHLTALLPSAGDQRLVYAGPFGDHGWIRSGGDDPGWRHDGSRLYHTGGRHSVSRQAAMPRRSILRFRAEGLSDPNFKVALFADLETGDPEADASSGEEAEPDQAAAAANIRVQIQGANGLQINPGNFQLRAQGGQLLQFRGGNGWLDASGSSIDPGGNHPAEHFGNCLLLSVQGRYYQLQRCGFDEDGNQFVHNLHSGGSTHSNPDTTDAIYELRCDLDQELVTFHIDGELQWQATQLTVPDLAESLPTGGGFGFLAESDAPIRISEIALHEWPGLGRPRREPKHGTHDLVRLADGNERFLGKVLAIRDGKLQLEGAYATLDVPWPRVAEVRFTPTSEDPAETPQALVFFDDGGRLSGRPIEADRDTLRLDSPLLGELELDLSHARLLDFDPRRSFVAGASTR